MDKDIRPTLSVVIPIHDMKGGAQFLWDSINALTEQTFQDFEIVIVKEGLMAENTNAGIQRARGKYIKILYLDDRLAHREALQDIVTAFQEDPTASWLITAVDNNPHPYYTDDIETGNNKLGSPSALTIVNEDPLLFDTNMQFLLDCDYYKRLYEIYGDPIILDDRAGVIMGIGDHQMTNILTDEDKYGEFKYLKKKYE
jgi:glycosyltransferase involved in cell wall biosynthesis